MVNPLLQTTPNLPRWCPCHNGAPPFFDLNGYICQKCGKTVCINCIYNTEKGFICGQCVKQIKPKKVIPLKSNEKISNKFSWYLNALVIFFIFIMVLSAASIFFKDSFFLFGVLAFFGFIIFIIFIFFKLINQKKSDKKEKELDFKKINELDEEIQRIND
jgi:positive regulator of sigma E activity